LGLFYNGCNILWGGKIDILNNYDEKIKKIKEVEHNALLELSRIRKEKDKIIADYITSLREKKIEDLRKDIQSS